MGIEPTSSAWKAEVLPLNYTRAYQVVRRPPKSPAFLTFWWRGEDSNLRRRSRQIYSLIPLATREPLPVKERAIVRERESPVNSAAEISHGPTKAPDGAANPSPARHPVVSEQQLEHY